MRVPLAWQQHCKMLFQCCGATCCNKNMDFSFAASVGASMLSDRLESAREAAESAANSAKASAMAAKERAQQVAANAATMDINSALELGQANAAALRDTAKQSVSSLGTKMSTISVEDFRSIASPAGNASIQPQAEDGSDSGADEAYASSSFSGVASRFGFSAARSPEKEGLLRQSGGGADGGAATGSAGSLGGGAAAVAAGGFAALRSVSERTLSTGTGLAKSVGSGLGLVEEKPREPDGALDRMCYRMCSCCPKLTRAQSLLGFAICFLFGGLLSLSALGSLPSLLLGNPAPFAFKYTFGNLLSLGSSSFLVGPSKQCRDMLQPERRTASLLYLCSLFGTLVSVFFLKWQLMCAACPTPRLPDEHSPTVLCDPRFPFDRRPYAISRGRAAQLFRVRGRAVRRPHLVYAKLRALRPAMPQAHPEAHALRMRRSIRERGYKCVRLVGRTFRSRDWSSVRSSVIPYKVNVSTMQS